MNAEIISFTPKQPDSLAGFPKNRRLDNDWITIGRDLGNDLASLINNEKAKNAKNDDQCKESIRQILTKKKSLALLKEHAGNDPIKLARGLTAYLAHFESGLPANTTLIAKEAAKSCGLPENFLLQKIKPIIEQFEILVKKPDNTFVWATLNELRKSKEMNEVVRKLSASCPQVVRNEITNAALDRLKEPKTYLMLSVMALGVYGMSEINSTLLAQHIIQHQAYAPHITLGAAISSAIRSGRQINKYQFAALLGLYISSLAVFGAAGMGGGVAQGLGNAFMYYTNQPITIIGGGVLSALLLMAAGAIPSFSKIADSIGHWWLTGKLSEVQITQLPESPTPIAVKDEHPVIEVLNTLGVKNVTLDAISTGAVVTQYRIKVPAGKMPALDGSDIARNLKVKSVRLNKNAGDGCIAVEVPNKNRTTILFDRQLQTENWMRSKAEMSLPIILGELIDGTPLVIDMSKAPHILLAGETGGGKSALLNIMLLSLINACENDDLLKLVLIDPKVVELMDYKDSTYLMKPVITDMHIALDELNNLVVEMESRYQKLAQAGVRNISDYHSKGHYMPYIVVVVDEFADLMMVVGKKVEELIARLAQKSRAAGIHLILATQRPSVDVITGLIKANMPTRIGLRTSSQFDSRTIIDSDDCKILLGNGDGFIKSPTNPIPLRFHGAFCPNDDVIKFVR